jgi:hypothetical protein
MIAFLCLLDAKTTPEKDYERQASGRTATTEARMWIDPHDGHMRTLEDASTLPPFNLLSHKAGLQWSQIGLSRSRDTGIFPLISL